jgi:hypothetical protein
MAGEETISVLGSTAARGTVHTNGPRRASGRFPGDGIHARPLRSVLSLVPDSGGNTTQITPRRLLPPHDAM